MQVFKWSTLKRFSKVFNSTAFWILSELDLMIFQTVYSLYKAKQSKAKQANQLQDVVLNKNRMNK